MSDLFSIGHDEMIACAEREVRMRRRVYPSRVANGSMSQEKANREIAVMEQIAMYLRDHDVENHR
jgi:hypothetical protein